MGTCLPSQSIALVVATPRIDQNEEGWLRRQHRLRPPLVTPLLCLDAKATSKGVTSGGRKSDHFHSLPSSPQRQTDSLPMQSIALVLTPP